MRVRRHGARSRSVSSYVPLQRGRTHESAETRAILNPFFTTKIRFNGAALMRVRRPVAVVVFFLFQWSLQRGRTHESAETWRGRAK